MSGIFVQHVGEASSRSLPQATMMPDGSLPDALLVTLYRRRTLVCVGSLCDTLPGAHHPRSVCACLAWLRRRGLVVSVYDRASIVLRQRRGTPAFDAQLWEHRHGTRRRELGDGRVEWGMEVEP